MGKLALIIALLFQVQPDASLVRARDTLRQLKSQLEAHQATLGAATELTTAKHQLRDWIDSRLAGQQETLDVRPSPKRCRLRFATPASSAMTATWTTSAMPTTFVSIFQHG